MTVSAPFRGLRVGWQGDFAEQGRVIFPYTISRQIDVIGENVYKRVTKLTGC
jgi:hypothetical protein